MFKIISPKKFLLLFLAAFIFKLAVSFYFAHLRKCSTAEKENTILASKSGDASFYLDPIDNFLEKGEYFIDNGFEKVVMGRAPYYGIPYFFLRTFFSKDVSYDLLVIFQLLMEALAIIYLAALCLLILKQQIAFWITYVLMMLSLNTTFWASNLITESLSISFLTFFAFYYYNYLLDKKKKILLLSGLFLSLVVLLKPYFSLLFIPIGIQFLTGRPFSVKRVLTNTLLVSIPLIVLAAPYTIRNIIKFNKFVAFSELYGGYHFTKATFAYRNFIQAWGGSIVFWDKRSAACYFEPKPNLPCEFQFPDYALCEGYSLDDIESVRNLYVKYQMQQSQALEDSVASSFNRLTTIYKESRPFRYYVISPLIMTRIFLFHSGSYYLPIARGLPCYKSYQMLIKIFQSLLYYFSLFAGMAGLVFLLRQNRNTYMLLLIPVFLILFFPLAIHATEFRYFAPSYPFLIIGCTLILLQIYEAIKKLADVNKSHTE